MSLVSRMHQLVQMVPPNKREDVYAAESAWLAAVKAGTAELGDPIGLSGAAAAHDLTALPVTQTAGGSGYLRAARWVYQLSPCSYGECQDGWQDLASEY